MAYTVNAAFAQFIQDEVELDKMQTKTARNSRDWLLSNIENLAQNKKIPRLYGGKSINHGSFARNTKIRPLDDIDLMVCYSGTGGVYHIVEENECYTISFSNGIQVLSNLCDEQGMLNSRKVIENLKGALADISGYAKADIHRNQEAATLQLTSYPWNFDIVPCFITTSDFYLIPDGKGNWKKTDPRIDQQRITKINQTNNGQLLGLIRLMKYWKKKKWGNRISSYMFETMILDYVACHSLSGCISQDVCSLLAYLSNAIKKPVYDYKNIQGNLNNLSIADKNELAAIAKNDWTLAFQAIIRNTDRFENISTAISLWKKIFGDKFPNYGK
ncbi:SMODS domain-containing nucleotidyltransferase [Segatella copri]|uniref:Nucleotidyltransferase n=1 Tax=Segatella copri TaxID=165179 RepID=A0AA93BC99_9BACT|nr:nucleotidyltransferase [Segatella copri]RGN05353.1 nucleotidyltransferase [Segatella copri]RGQ08610.1 nucleotidyltransferase [Segatella copri]